MSQPALSSQIRDLEDDVGFNLLERTAKSVRLTDAGRVFLEQTRAVLQQVDDAVKTARAVASGRQSELHVGYIASVAAHLLPRILRACQHSISNVHVKLHEQSNEPNLRDLLAGASRSTMIFPVLFLQLRPGPVSLLSPGFAYAVGERVKLLRLNPEPKTAVLGIAAPMGRLSPAAEKFWECAKEAASAKSFRQPGK